MAKSRRFVHPGSRGSTTLFVFILIATIVINVSVRLLLVSTQSQSIDSSSSSPIVDAPSIPATTTTTLKDDPSVSSVKTAAEQPDGFYYNRTLKYIDAVVPESRSHCIGNNFQENAHIYRSCEFRYLCYDTAKSAYVLHTDQQPFELAHDGIYSSTSFVNQTFTITGQERPWVLQGSGRWYPTVRGLSGRGERGYYLLDPNTLWVPSMPHHSCNPGHLIWDFMLPLFLLREIFDHSEKQLLPFPYYPGTVRELFADTKWINNHFPPDNSPCATNLRKFLPLINISHYHGITPAAPEFIPPPSSSSPSGVNNNSNNGPHSDLICSRHAASGLAMLSDHGLGFHGKLESDYQQHPINLARGPYLRQFRAWSMNNIGLGHLVVQQPSFFRPPYSIVVNRYSSRKRPRKIGFEIQVEALEKVFSGDSSSSSSNNNNNKTSSSERMVVVKPVVMKELSLEEQVTLAATSAFFISASGGGCVTATYLPKGASLILYYSDNERLDWDLWNHYSDINVHWLPMKDMNKPNGLRVLEDVIRQDMRRFRD